MRRGHSICVVPVAFSLGLSIRRGEENKGDLFVAVGLAFVELVWAILEEEQ